MKIVFTQTILRKTSIYAIKLDVLLHYLFGISGIYCYRTTTQTALVNKKRR